MRLGILLTFLVCVPAAQAQVQPDPDEKMAVEYLSKVTSIVKVSPDNGKVELINFWKKNAVTDETLYYVSGLTGLKKLYLNKATITDAGMGYLKDLTNLELLHMANMPVTDAGFVHLKELKNLHTLNIAGTHIRDAGLMHLKGLKNLRVLYLAKTRITSDGVRDLKRANPQLEIR